MHDAVCLPEPRARVAANSQKATLAPSAPLVPQAKYRVAHEVVLRLPVSIRLIPRLARMAVVLEGGVGGRSEELRVSRTMAVVASTHRRGELDDAVLEHHNDV